MIETLTRTLPDPMFHVCYLLSPQKMLFERRSEAWEGRKRDVTPCESGELGKRQGQVGHSIPAIEGRALAGGGKSRASQRR